MYMHNANMSTSIYPRKNSQSYIIVVCFCCVGYTTTQLLHSVALAEMNLNVISTSTTWYRPFGSKMTTSTMTDRSRCRSKSCYPRCRNLHKNKPITEPVWTLFDRTQRSFWKMNINKVSILLFSFSVDILYIHPRLWETHWYALNKPWPLFWWSWIIL